MRTLLIFTSCLLLGGCDSYTPTSASGISQASVAISPGADSLTTEQRNIRDRVVLDNKPGSVKHLYVISAYSGQVIIYSTVRGKVTSGGKRLTPTTATPYERMYINIGGHRYQTAEILQDDGSYGSSDPYIFWFDTKGIYHQHFLGGGQIVHLSDQPLAVKSIIINTASE